MKRISAVEEMMRMESLTKEDIKKAGIKIGKTDRSGIIEISPDKGFTVKSYTGIPIIVPSVIDSESERKATERAFERDCILLAVRCITKCMFNTDNPKQFWNGYKEGE